MLRFKPKKEGQKFTYKGFWLIAVKARYNDFNSTCYECAIRRLRLYKDPYYKKPPCAKAHMCKKDNLYFLYAGKVKQNKR